jgi:dihydropteroate synthase
MLEAGIGADRIVLDPGLGFAKVAAHNWELLRHLDQVQSLGHRVLVGASRKAFLGSLLAGPDGTGRPVDGREQAGVALTVLLAGRGVWGLRVHDVRAHRDALRVVAEMEVSE